MLERLILTCLLMAAAIWFGGQAASHITARMSALSTVITVTGG